MGETEQGREDRVELAPKARQFALVVVQNTTEGEREAFSEWLTKLIAIREQSGSSLHKARSSIELTLRSQVVWPTVKILAQEMKRHAWDERKPTTRLAAIGALGGALAFGSQGAGIAALGTAIGVPFGS